MTTTLTPGEQYLYVVEFDSGVKVGITADPSRRIAQHRRDAEAFARNVGRTWISPVPHGNARQNELELKQGSRREYLTRSFDECVAHAERLPMARLDPVAVERRSANFLSAMQAFVTGGVR